MRSLITPKEDTEGQLVVIANRGLIPVRLKGEISIRREIN